MSGPELLDYIDYQIPNLCQHRTGVWHEILKARNKRRFQVVKDHISLIEFLVIWVFDKNNKGLKSADFKINKRSSYIIKRSSNFIKVLYFVSHDECTVHGSFRFVMEFCFYMHFVATFESTCM